MIDQNLSSPAQAVSALMTELGETSYPALKQMRLIVQLLGSTQALALLVEAQQIEEAGGLLVPDGSRRCTPGGVFFLLVQHRMSETERATVWPKRVGLLAPITPAAPGTPAFKSTNIQTPKSQQGPSPLVAAFSWAERIAIVKELAPHKGEATTVKITLIGRPGKVIEKHDCVITSMQSMKTPSLPKGVPVPPNTPTDYTVYIALKQWRNVAAAIQQPNDSLIVEGFAAYDPELEGMAVFATSVTTKAKAVAKRQQQAGEA